MMRIATAADAPAIAAILEENIDDRGFAHCEVTRAGTEARAAGLAEYDLRHPTFVHVDARGDVQGWCALKPLMARPCWSDVAEISLHVRRSSRNRVVGAQLLVQLLDAARVRDFGSLMAVVLARNTASVRGLEMAGFREVARMREAVFLYGETIDLLWLQKPLGPEREPTVAHYAARFRTAASDPLAPSHPLPAGADR
jgi:L-amino acid N-acyltransferase YncA